MGVNKTEYVVLQENGGGYGVIGRVEAMTSLQAVKSIVGDEGTYVAVPWRSWKPVTVTVEKREPRLIVKSNASTENAQEAAE